MLADAALIAGDTDEAIALGREAVAVLRSLDQPANLGLALANLSSALLMQGDVGSARAAAAQALPLMWRNEFGACLFEALALIAASTGSFAVAAQMLGYADGRYAADDDVPQANEARMARLAAAAIDTALGEGEHARLRDVGAQLAPSPRRTRLRNRCSPNRQRAAARDVTAGCLKAPTKSFPPPHSRKRSRGIRFWPSHGFRSAVSRFARSARTTQAGADQA